MEGIDVALLEAVFERLAREERTGRWTVMHPAFEDLLTWLGWRGAELN